MMEDEYVRWRDTVNALFAACVEADVIPAESILAWFRQAVEDDHAYHANVRPAVSSTPTFGIVRTDSLAPVRRFT
jgi:hypothetical protein